MAQGVGGAIDQEDETDVTILRSTFTQNASLGDTGGAINANGGDQTISVTDSKFTFNSALEQGGAIAADGETVKILRSTFDHNSSVNDDGGADRRRHHRRHRQQVHVQHLQGRRRRDRFGRQ